LNYFIDIIFIYTAGGYEHFSIESIGASELVDLLGEQERRRRQVDDSIPIIYDINKPSCIQYSAKGLKGIICSVKGSDIARLVRGEREKTIFDLNLRRYYGIKKGGVNPSIAETSSNQNESHMFWFFNNGITIVCDKCDLTTDPDHAQIKLTNMQIVNGCQTSMTLSEVASRGDLQNNVEVLVKIFETTDDKFVSKVVLTTNNQNAINSRDLKANDKIQDIYQLAFKKFYDLFYERKPREFKDILRTSNKYIVSNERVAQAFLAIVKKKPTIARTQKYKIWDDEWYNQIFPPTTIEKHVLAYLIYDFCLKAKNDELQLWQKDPIRYRIVSYGVFHLARVVAYRFTKKENWDVQAETQEWIKSIQTKPTLLNRHYKSAISLIHRLIKKRKDWVENINNVFKATDIETTINKELHKRDTI
jgi:hypothetical protein